MEFYRQKVELMAGGKSFNNEDFEIDFVVEFGNSSEPNISKVMIYNLSDQTIAAIRAKAYIIMNCGYGMSVGNILTGKVDKAETYWEEVDKVTEIYVGDGSFEWNFKRINKTYASGSTSKLIVSDLASQLGLEIAELNLEKDITFPRGRSVSGATQYELRKLVSETGSRVFIDKGKLYIRPKNKGTVTGFVLNVDTGLIESPQKITEEDKKGNSINKYNVRCLLNHKITTDSILVIESKTANGKFRVVKGRHTGDFITECEVVPM
ncbi:hypothetical protein KQI38_05440 [Tissierella carlieri]|uniref:phage protein n=1 Tax=Tissierella carlieri TaxID=689904 RepID=UPI001C124067|nr:hypothetical protein [Tissierella carlieri]MBU5311464.1 hypothetical protein [Tissierella carlieri]